MASSFNFGAKTTAAPTLGTSSFSFGTSTSQPQGLSFGATPASSAAAPSLLGTPAAAPTATAAPLLGSSGGGLFSATTSAPTFGVGTALPTLNTGLSFGTPAAATIVPATTLSFGTPAATTLNFGAPAATTSTLSFGLPGSTAGTTTSAPSLGFNFGSSAATTTTTTPAFGLSNTPAASTAPTGLTFNLSAPATTSGIGSFGLGGTTATTAPTVTGTVTPLPTGLGGIATTTQSRNTGVTTQKEIPPKDQPLQNEILQTVEAFKTMLKQQRNHSSDITRCSVKDFRRVEQEIGHLSNQINGIESQLQKNRQLAEKLKHDTAKTVQIAEMAQRTHETPPGLQYENTAPLKFFLDLADQFERDMQNLKLQIEAADKYVKYNKNPDTLTPQDLSMGMRRLHETFVALAGRLQSVHSQVESQKETFTNIRKHLVQDINNPFEQVTKTPEFQLSNIQRSLIASPPKVATGPTPFNNLIFGNVHLGSQQNNSPSAYPTAPSNTATGFGTTLNANQPSNTSLFGSSFGQPSFNNSFQLQKPPTGTKRGKI